MAARGRTRRGGSGLPLKFYVIFVYDWLDFVHTGAPAVRTNIEIDDKLMARAMELTGLPTKRAVVDAALRASIERRSRQLLRES